MSRDLCKYRNVTSLALKVDKEYSNFKEIWYCEDIRNNWICRITEGYNEKYEKEEGKWLIERNNTYGDTIRQNLEYDVEDGFCNWDVYECNSYKECIEILDGGYGLA